MSMWFVFQPEPQFQSLFKKGQNPSASSSAEPASETVNQPLSYAEFIVQSAPLQREGPSKPPGTGDAGVTNRKQSETASVLSASEGPENVQDSVKRIQGDSEGVKKNEGTQEMGTDQIDGNCQRLDPGLIVGPKPVGSGSSIIVSPRQVSSKMHHGSDNGKLRFVQAYTPILDTFTLVWIVLP